MAWQQHGGRLALIVEDNDNVREVLVGIIASAGWRTQAARHGAEAFELIGHGPAPAIVVLDLMMPVMDGWRFVQQLRATPALADVPVVGVSAFTVTAGGRADIDALVPKPFDPDDLLAGMEQAIRVRRAHGSRAGI